MTSVLFSDLIRLLDKVHRGEQRSGVYKLPEPGTEEDITFRVAENLGFLESDQDTAFITDTGRFFLDSIRAQEDKVYRMGTKYHWIWVDSALVLSIPNKALGAWVEGKGLWTIFPAESSYEFGQGNTLLRGKEVSRDRAVEVVESLLDLVDEI